MNKIERLLDEADPRVSVYLRALKMRWRHDMAIRLIQNMIQVGDVAADIGANRGVYAYLMSIRVGPGGRVHAVEPFPGDCDRLRKVARWRGNIVVHPVAASDHSGSEVLRVPIYDGHPIDALATLEPNRSLREQSHVVPVYNLDDLLEGERRVSFLKCDVEGHEQRVFLGAARIINRDHPIVLAEVEQRHRSDNIYNTFKYFFDAGYSGWFVAEGWLHPLEEFDTGRDQLAFIKERFIPYAMPAGYVSDFVFCPQGTIPPSVAFENGISGARRRDIR